MAGRAVNRVGRGFPWRPIGWGSLLVVTLIPLIAGFPWSLADYIFVGAVLGGAGMLIELGARMSTSPAYRFGVAVAVLTAVLLVWVNGAVGFLGDADNPENLVFGAVILIAVVGAARARFRPAGMARALFATAAAQLAIGIVAIAIDVAVPGRHWLYEAVLGTTLFTALWLVSAGLLRKAAREPMADESRPPAS